MKIFNLFFLAVLISTACILAQEDELKDRLKAEGYRLEMPLQRQEMEDRRWKMEVKAPGCSFQKIEGSVINEVEYKDVDNQLSFLANDSVPISHLPSSSSYLGVKPKLMMNPVVEGAEGTIEKLIVGESRVSRSIESNHLGVVDKNSVNLSVECATANHQSSSSYVCSSDPELPSSISHLPSPTAAAVSTAYSLQPIASIRPAGGRIVPSSLTPLVQAEAEYKRAVSDHQKAMANFTAAHHHWAIAQNFPIRQLQVAQGDYESARINYNNIAQQAQWAHADYTGFQKIVQEALSAEVIWHANAKNQETSYKQVFDDIHLKLGEASRNIEGAKVRCDQAQVYPRSSDYLLWLKNSADQLAEAQRQVNKTATIMKTCNQKIVSCLLANNVQKNSNQLNMRTQEKEPSIEDKHSVPPSVECAMGSTNHQGDFSNSDQRLQPIAYSLQPIASIQPVGQIITSNLVENIKEEIIQKSQLEEKSIPVKKKKMKKVPQTVAQHSINLSVEKEVIETNCITLQPPSHFRNEASSEKNTDEFDECDNKDSDNRLLSKIADADEVQGIQVAGRPLDRLPLGSPVGVSRAGASESIDGASGSLWQELLDASGVDISSPSLRDAVKIDEARRTKNFNAGLYASYCPSQNLSPTQHSLILSQVVVDGDETIRSNTGATPQFIASVEFGKKSNEEESIGEHEEEINIGSVKQLCSKKKIKKQQQAKALKEKIAAKKEKEAERKALNEDIQALHTKAEKADSESNIARKKIGKDTSPETENTLLIEMILKEFHAEKIWKQLEKAYERGADLVPENLKSSWMTKLQNAKFQKIRCYADGLWNSARKAANEALILRDQIAKKTTTQEWTAEEEEAFWKKAALLEIRAMVVWDTFQQIEDDLKQLPEQWQVEARKRINYAKNQKQICDISVRWSSAKQLAALAVINRNEAKRVVDTENEEKNLFFNKAIDKAEATRKSFNDISNILTNILGSSICSISNTNTLNSVSTQLTTAWPASLWITYLADAQREESFWVAKKAEWILDKEKALQSYGTMTPPIEEIKTVDGDIAGQDSINPLGEYPNATTNQQNLSNCAYSSRPLLPFSTAAAVSLAFIATMTWEDIQKTIHELEEKVEEAEVSANDAKKAALATDVDVRLLSKFASADEVQGVDGAEKLSVQKLLDASSTGATKQFAAEVEVGNKSIEGMNRRLDNAILKARHAETLYTQLEAVYRRGCDVIPSAFQELWIEEKEHLLNNALEKKMDWDSVALFFNIKKIEQKITCFTMEAIRVTNHEQEADQASLLASIEMEAVEAWDHFIEVHQSSLSQVPENLKERWHTKIKMAELKKTTCNIGVAFSRAHERSARTMIIKNQAMIASAAEKPALWDKAIEQAEETREALDQIIQTITTIQEKTPQNLSPCLSEYLKAAQHKKQFFISIIKEWEIKKGVSVQISPRANSPKRVNMDERG